MDSFLSWRSLWAAQITSWVPSLCTALMQNGSIPRARRLSWNDGQFSRASGRSILLKATTKGLSAISGLNSSSSRRTASNSSSGCWDEPSTTWTWASNYQDRRINAQQHKCSKTSLTQTQSNSTITRIIREELSRSCLYWDNSQIEVQIKDIGRYSRDLAFSPLNNSTKSPYPDWFKPFPLYSPRWPSLFTNLLLTQLPKFPPPCPHTKSNPQKVQVLTTPRTK